MKRTLSTNTSLFSPEECQELLRLSANEFNIVLTTLKAMVYGFYLILDSLDLTVWQID